MAPGWVAWRHGAQNGLQTASFEYAMPLKIRCPHCKRTLVADDETAGEGKLCPACGKGFTVPIPVHDSPRHVEVAGTCPKCRADMAPGTPYCPHCYYEPATGKRLPLRRRLEFVSVRTWILMSLGMVIAVALGFAGVRLYRDQAGQDELPPSGSANCSKPGRSPIEPRPSTPC